MEQAASSFKQPRRRCQWANVLSHILCIGHHSVDPRPPLLAGQVHAKAHRSAFALGQPEAFAGKGGDDIVVLIGGGRRHRDVEPDPGPDPRSGAPREDRAPRRTSAPERVDQHNTRQRFCGAPVGARERRRGRRRCRMRLRRTTPDGRIQPSPRSCLCPQERSVQSAGHDDAEGAAAARLPSSSSSEIALSVQVNHCLSTRVQIMGEGVKHLPGTDEVDDHRSGQGGPLALELPSAGCRACAEAIRRRGGRSRSGIPKYLGSVG